MFCKKNNQENCEKYVSRVKKKASKKAQGVYRINSYNYRTYKL